MPPSNVPIHKTRYEIFRHHHIPVDYRHNLPAGFWVRASAAVIDGVICSLLVLFATLFVSVIAPSHTVGLILVCQIVFITSYFVFSNHYFGHTVGKRLFHLKVVHGVTGKFLSLRSSLVRELVGKSLSIMVLCLGFVMAGFGRKLALHDRLAGSRVIVDTYDQ